MLFVSPKFAWKSHISQLHESIARWQRKRMSPPGDQNMHRLQLFSTPWKLRIVVKTKTCQEKKENGRRTSGTLSLWHTIIVWQLMLYLRNNPYNTISFRWNRTAMGDNTATGLVSWLRLQCLLPCEFWLRFRRDRRLSLWLFSVILYKYRPQIVLPACPGDLQACPPKWPILSKRQVCRSALHLHFAAC